MDITLCLGSILIGLLSGVVFFFKRRFAYWKNRGVPYLEPTIPFGNMANVGSTRHVVDLFDEIYSKFKRTCSFAGAFISISPVAIITDLELIKMVLIKDFNYFSDRKMYCNEEVDPLTGNLIFMQGHKWKMMRSKISPTFTSGKMKFMYPTFIDVTDKFVVHLTEILKKNNNLEMKELLARYTTDIIGTCAFGIECNSLKDPNSEFRLNGMKVFNDQRYSKIVSELIMQFPDIAKALKVRFFPDSVIDFFTNVVTETIEFRESNDIHRNDFIDLLIEMKNEKRPDAPKLNLMEIVAQVFVFFLAGFETSSTTMSYSLYELAKNPALQLRARKEIDKVLSKHNGEISYEAIMDMTYIDQIISESLRKYPVLMALTRNTNTDYKVPGTDKTIEKGTGVFIPVYSIHRDPDIYPEPEVYDPERFNPDQIQNRHPMAFLGFGDGPRNCIGMRFGQMQSRIGLVTLLKNFQFKLASDTTIEFDPKAFVLTTKGGLNLIVEKHEIA